MKKEVLARERSLDGMKVEDAFAEIKDFLELRPIRHHPDPRVKAHVTVWVIAYLIEGLLEKALEQLAPLKVV